MKKEGLIDRIVFSIFVSRFESNSHSLQIGDYDTTFIDGGEKNLSWFHLDDVMDSRWFIDITAAHLGETSIFSHS